MKRLAILTVMLIALLAPATSIGARPAAADFCFTCASNAASIYESAARTCIDGGGIPFVCEDQAKQFACIYVATSCPYCVSFEIYCNLH